MGFFNKPFKAIKGFVNKFVPGGKYLTGKAAEHQKFHYKTALRRYDSYATESKNQVSTLSQNLQQAKQTLNSLNEQKYHSDFQGQQIKSTVSRYQSLVSNLEQKKEQLGSEAGALKSAFESFKRKAPELANKISELEQLPTIFQNLYDKTVAQKEKLKGLTTEEAAIHIKKHKADVEDLKQQRQQIEAKIRSSMDEIMSQHSGLEGEKINLEQKLKSYKYHQDHLINVSSNFQDQRSQLENTIRDYKADHDRISEKYARQQTRVYAEEQKLKDYIRSAQNNLDALGREVNWRARKYKRESKTTGLVQGGALLIGTLALGAGVGGLANNLTTSAALSGASTSTPLSAQVLGGLATGLSYAAPMLGGMRFLSALNSGLQGVDRIELSRTNTQNANLSNIAKYGLGGFKVSIPELGGLKQSLEHFNMPIIPKLKDLPQLDKTLGKIVNLKDIESLGLGLPSITSASGRKYSHQVLYDPEFIRKLKKVSYKLGSRYLKQHNTSGINRINYG